MGATGAWCWDGERCREGAMGAIGAITDIIQRTAGVKVTG